MLQHRTHPEAGKEYGYRDDEYSIQHTTTLLAYGTRYIAPETGYSILKLYSSIESIARNVRYDLLDSFSFSEKVL